MSTDLSNAASNSASNAAMLEANYARALSVYPGQVIVDLKALRDNMRTLVARVSQDLQPSQNAPEVMGCLLYTSPSPRDVEESRMPSSA